MAISETAPPIEYQSWPQGDVRDPLGIWGFRHGITGDATGGTIKVILAVLEAKRSAFVYTVYSAHIAQLTGVVGALNWKLRIQTNWPNIDVQAGVQAFSTLKIGNFNGATFTAPNMGPFPPGGPMVEPNDRFILLYDPRQPATLGSLPILEYELSGNVDTNTYSFEAWGYYWDRAVMQAPGGPRHPGSA